MICLYAHGFEGQPDGPKARYLERAGHTLIAPAMNADGFCLADEVAIVLREIDQRPDLRLVVGSSMGALAAMVAATRRPSRSLRLVLLAPAVGVHDAWYRELGAEGLELWRTMGSLSYHHKGVGREVSLPYSLYTECAAAAKVVVHQPAVIVHGLHDAVIPVENAVALARRSPGVQRLIAVDDGHRLLDHLGCLGEAIRLLSDA